MYKYDTACFSRLLSYLIKFQLFLFLELLCTVLELLKPFEERRGLVTMYHVFY